MSQLSPMLCKACSATATAAARAVNKRLFTPSATRASEVAGAIGAEGGEGLASGADQSEAPFTLSALVRTRRRRRRRRRRRSLRNGTHFSQRPPVVELTRKVGKRRHAIISNRGARGLACDGRDPRGQASKHFVSKLRNPP